MPIRLKHALIAACVAWTGWAGPAAAQTGATIQIIIPYGPGGSTDVLGRMLGDLLGKALQHPVVTVNQPGAGGELGSLNVARAKPDGNTLLFQAPAVTIIQALKKSPALDVRRDLTPITLALEGNVGFYINPTLPVKTIAELIDYARAHPGKLNYASFGAGSSAHLYTELFKKMARLDIVHVPYTGGNASTAAVARNDAQIVLADSLGSPRPLVEAGKLRMLAVGSKQRSPAFPDVPTVAESGLPGYEAAHWLGFFAPAATPPDIVGRLNSAITAILKSPEIHERFTRQGYTVVASSPEYFRSFVRGEVSKWETLVREANIPQE